MNDPENHYLREAVGMVDLLRDIRRDLHRFPELGREEHRTSDIVAGYLRDLGLEVQSGVGGTGVVGLFRGERAGKTVALRADMDALPLKDLKPVPYASRKPGLAHACGHDGHTAGLLGAAFLLARRAQPLPGNVKFVFQPSEDRPPGGALPMIRDGVLDEPKVDGIYALHLHPSYPEGHVAVRSGFSTASSADFILRLIGRGGHAAMPDGAVDPIAMAAMVIQAAQNIISRQVDPREPSVLTFGSIHGGDVPNVIPEEVTLTGTIRTLRPEARTEIAALLEKAAKGVAAVFGGGFRLETKEGYPAVLNHAGLTETFIRSAAKVVGRERIIAGVPPLMGGEDMAYFHQRVPGVFWLMGTANDAKGFSHPLHSPRFDFDDRILAQVAAVHAQSAEDFLKGPAVAMSPAGAG